MPSGEVPCTNASLAAASCSAVDCSALAGRFGGGGHKAAAGAIMPGPFEAAHERVTAAVDEAVRAADMPAA